MEDGGIVSSCDGATFKGDRLVCMFSFIYLFHFYSGSNEASYTSTGQPVVEQVWYSTIYHMATLILP